jgi:hypothetical protein
MVVFEFKNGARYLFQPFFLHGFHFFSKRGIFFRNIKAKRKPDPSFFEKIAISTFAIDILLSLARSFFALLKTTKLISYVNDFHVQKRTRTRIGYNAQNAGTYSR